MSRKSDKITMIISSLIALGVIAVFIVSFLPRNDLHSNAVQTLNRIAELGESEAYQEFLDDSSGIHGGTSDAQMIKVLEENKEFVDDVMDVMVINGEINKSGSALEKKLIALKRFYDFEQNLERPAGTTLNIVDDGITTQDGISSLSFSSVFIQDEEGTVVDYLEGSRKSFYLVNEGKSVSLDKPTENKTDLT